MNEFLAEMYSTREVIGAESNSDVEKLAEAQLLDEALRAEGVDIDQLPGDTILKLAYQLLGEDSHLVKAAQEAASEEAGETAESEEAESEEEEKEESMEEKVAQADFLGRVMAHSYVSELSELEKSAGVGSGLEALGKGIGKRVAGKDMSRAVSQKLDPAHAKAIGAGALAAGGAAAGGAAYGAKKLFGKKKDKEKKSSALDALAEKRAMEWAESVGLLQNEPDEENEKLAAAVNQRAYEMLTEQGVDVDAIEAHLQGQE